MGYLVPIVGNILSTAFISSPWKKHMQNPAYYLTKYLIEMCIHTIMIGFNKGKHIICVIQGLNEVYFDRCQSLRL